MSKGRDIGSRAVVSLAVLFTLWGVEARAQGLAPRPVPEVPVHLMSRSGETLQVRVHAPGTEGPGPACITPCRVRVAPGRYRLQVLETPGVASGSQLLDVTDETRVVVTPDRHAHRMAGLALGLSGIALTVAAAIVHPWQPPGPWGGTSSYSAEEERRRSAAAGLAVGGAFTSFVGWVMYGRSFRPELDVQPIASATRPAVHHGSGEPLPTGRPGRRRLFR